MKEIKLVNVISFLYSMPSSDFIYYSCTFSFKFTPHRPNQHRISDSECHILPPVLNGFPSFHCLLIEELKILVSQLLNKLARNFREICFSYSILVPSQYHLQTESFRILNMNVLKFSLSFPFWKLFNVALRRLSKVDKLTHREQQ